MKLANFLLALLMLVQSSKQTDLFEELSKCFDNRLTSTDSQSVSILLAHSRLQFTVDFTKTVLQRMKIGSNIFFSPHSVYQALMLALFISRSHTEKSIKSALRLPETIDKLNVLQEFILEREFQKVRFANGSSGSELNVANRIFYQNSLPVRECMKWLFKDDIYGVDFQTNPHYAKDFIDNWVSNQTKYQINNLLANADLSENTKLILVNAMYFKGLWQSKFLRENTKKEVFFMSPARKTLVPMMRQNGNFKYLISENLNAHVLAIPYKGEDISMYIILPSFYKPDGIRNLLEKLTTDTISELVQPVIVRPVELAIPKFTVEHTLDDLVSILESMGIGDFFRNTSDLSELTNDQDLSFNDVIHKAKISIDEEGTIAAAASAIFTYRSSRPLDPIKFICSHPFIYFLFDHVSQTILFIGVYSSPV